MDLIWTAKNYLDRFIAPPFCTQCRIFLEQDTVLCDQCIKLIQPVITYTLKIDNNYSIPVVALGAYKEPLFSLVHAKNSGNPTASRQLGTLLWHYAAWKQYPADVIVPIPLHWSRMWWRGFNQATIMAQELSQHSTVPVAHLLRRERRTFFQRLLSAREREQNVKRAFALTSQATNFTNKHIIIVDDVLTTGVTMQEAVRTLRKIKPASITALVAARVID